MDAKLVSSLPALYNQNNLDPEPQSVPVIMTNPDNQHYNQPSRSISPLAEHNTNNPNSRSLSNQPIESGTSRETKNMNQDTNLGREREIIQTTKKMNDRQK
jgi:hypothetical protein